LTGSLDAATFIEATGEIAPGEVRRLTKERIFRLQALLLQRRLQILHYSELQPAQRYCGEKAISVSGNGDRVRARRELKEHFRRHGLESGLGDDRRR
jgi:hypothetical protein